MFQNRSPRDLYQEYEARVDRAVRNYQRAAKMQPLARTRRSAQPRLRAWLTTMRRHLERLQQSAEDGSTA